MLPIAINLLKSYWKPLVGFLIVAFIWGHGNSVGRSYEKGLRNAEKAKIILAQKEIEKHNVKTAFEIGSGYAQIKDDIYGDYDKRINSLPEPTSSDAGKSNATSRTNETPACSGLSQANKRKLLTLAREAEINTQQLIHLQKWVREVK